MTRRSPWVDSLFPAPLLSGGAQVCEAEAARRPGALEAWPPLTKAPLAAGRCPAPSTQQAPSAVWETAVTRPCGTGASTSLP